MLSIITINTQGLRTLGHRQTLSWLNCFEPDLICMQETHATSEKELDLWFSKNNLNINNKLNYQSNSSPSTTRSAGVALLYKPCFQVVKKVRDEAGRLIIAELCRDDLNF